MFTWLKKKLFKVENYQKMVNVPILFESKSAFELLVILDKVSFGDDTIEFFRYPFSPSLVYPSKKLSHQEIIDVAIDTWPPTIRVKNELLFISAKQKDELSRFSTSNKLIHVKRPMIWDSILDEFLDTQFTSESKEKTYKYLEENGISKNETIRLRNEVSDQMMKYNFDTMLWEWCNLSLYDVLCAMRVKLTTDKYNEFYLRAMEVALRTV